VLAAGFVGWRCAFFEAEGLDVEARGFLGQRRVAIDVGDGRAHSASLDRGFALLGFSLLLLLLVLLGVSARGGCFFGWRGCELGVGRECYQGCERQGR